MNLDEQLVRTLERFMDPPHLNPFKLHELAIPLIMQSFVGVGEWLPGSSPAPSSSFAAASVVKSRRPVVLQAPTGHGKTAAFTLPILQVFLLFFLLRLNQSPISFA